MECYVLVVVVVAAAVVFMLGYDVVAVVVAIVAVAVVAVVVLILVVVIIIVLVVAILIALDLVIIIIIFVVCLFVCLFVCRLIVVAAVNFCALCVTVRCCLPSADSVQCRVSPYCHANVVQLWSSLSETRGITFPWRYGACLPPYEGASCCHRSTGPLHLPSKVSQDNSSARLKETGN